MQLAAPLHIYKKSQLLNLYDPVGLGACLCDELPPGVLTHEEGTLHVGF